jgi:hypothetical protein
LNTSGLTLKSRDGKQRCDASGCLKDFFALDDANEDHNDCDDEQDVDESADGVAGDHAEEPCDDQDQCECV